MQRHGDDTTTPGDGTATWLPMDAPYASTMAVAGAAFTRPSVRGTTRRVARIGAVHPTSVLRMIAAGLTPKQIASALLWRETGQYFGIRALIDAEGQPAPESAALGRPIERSRDATSLPRPAITGVLIAQNEEDVIGTALDSLAPFVDELIVLDGGSSDSTVDVARSHGATVAHRAFTNDFAAQRNALLDLVRTPWVISLDCDERLSHELGELASGILSDTRADTLITPHLNLVGDDPQPTHWPDSHPRIFRSYLRYRGAVHERLGYRRPLFTPANGPFIEHHKTPLRFTRGAIKYSEIDPTLADPESVKQWRHWLTILEDQDKSGQDKS